MPSFPNRPDHPDFWLLAAAVQDADHQADAGQELPDILARYIDPASLLYVAEQRMGRLAAQLGFRTPAMRAALQSAWLDAFTAGVRFQLLKTQPEDDEQLSPTLHTRKEEGT